MKAGPALEEYLAKIDRALGQVSLSDRAAIITDIKKYVLESLERDPASKLEDVLTGLGGPELVANRYLRERGLKTVKGPRSPMIKWLTIGFLGTFGFFLLFITIMVWRFSPIIKVDENNDRVTLFGGVIDISGRSGSLLFGEEEVVNELHSLEGNVDFAGSHLKEVRLNYINGKFIITTSTDRHLRWNCKSKDHKGSHFASEEGVTLVLSSQGAGHLSCELEVPKEVKFHAVGTNGKIKVIHPAFSLDLKVTNGLVALRPDPSRNYRYEMSVINGEVEGLESTESSDSIDIKISIVNGNIRVIPK